MTAIKERKAELIDQHLDELAAFESGGFPVVSLYLNTQPNQHGHDNFDSFVRKEFAAVARSFAPESFERASFERDAERIKAYLRDELRPSANGVALFACAGANDYFKALQFEAPFSRHGLHVGQFPHLYPLARLVDQHSRYVALVADTNSARLFVFGLGWRVALYEVNGFKVSRTRGGVWSQMRYQRHADNLHLLHAKEVVEALGRVVREEGDHIVLAGDEVIISLMREQLPPALREKVIDVLWLDVRTPEDAVLKATMESLREHNTQTDAERVRRLLDEYRAGGLAVVGARDTLSALYQGQADELLLSASAREIRLDEEDFDGAKAKAHGVPAQLLVEGREPHLLAADLLVAHARQTGARVTFVEDAALLADVGGVGALLRYRL